MKKCMYDCPFEILDIIVKYCDDRSLLNLSKVNCAFYHATKKYKKNIKNKIVDFAWNKHSGIFRYIINNDITRFNLLLSLQLINPDSGIIITSNMLWMTNGSIVNDGECGERSIIDICIRYNRVEMVRLLIKHGLAINSKNMFGQTPLMRSVMEPGNSNGYSYDIISILLKAGADPNIENYNGYIAMDMINSNYGNIGAECIQEMLREYGSHEGASIDYDYQYDEINSWDEEESVDDYDY